MSGALLWLSQLSTTTIGSLDMGSQLNREGSLNGAFVPKTFGISEKNIPRSNKKEHNNMQLIYRTEKLVKRMRWEAFFFLNPQEGGSSSRAVLRSVSS